MRVRSWRKFYRVSIKKQILVWYSRSGVVLFHERFLLCPTGVNAAVSPPRYIYTLPQQRSISSPRLPLLSYHGAGVDFLFNYKFFRLPNRALISSRAPSGCPATSLECRTTATGAVQIDGEFFVPIIRWRADSARAAGSSDVGGRTAF